MNFIPLSAEIKRYIDKSVLCWLATSDKDNQPNVSPKEIFTHFENTILIAHIASPHSVHNLDENDKVCVSFIDIYEQKGFKVKGLATVVSGNDKNYNNFLSCLYELTQGLYPIKAIIRVKPTLFHPIVAPSYFLFPNESVIKKINKAKKHYYEVDKKYNY